MSDSVIAEPRPTLSLAEKAPKSAAKKQTTQPQFPFRMTVCFAPDQIETLAVARRIYRCTNSFAIRLAWDHFTRANNIIPGGK